MDLLDLFTWEFAVVCGVLSTLVLVVWGVQDHQPVVFAGALIDGAFAAYSIRRARETA